MFIEINGIKTNYIAENKADSDKNILLLHGWGSNITLFQQIINQLSPFYNVYALDMPGFGETYEPPIAWCVDDYVDFVLKFCNEIKLDNTVMLGHSFGGRVIIKMLSRNNCPIKCEKIILVDSAGILPKKSAKDKLRLKAFKTGKAVLQFAPVKALFPSALENLRKKHGSADYNSATPVMRQTLVKVVNEDLEPFLPLLKQSALLIWGDKDDVTPISDAKIMEEKIPDAGLVAVPEAGHFSFLQNPVLVRNVLYSFLKIS